MVLELLLDRVVLVEVEHEGEAIGCEAYYVSHQGEPTDGSRNAPEFGAMVRQHEVKRLAEIVHLHELAAALVTFVANKKRLIHKFHFLFLKGVHFKKVILMVFLKPKKN